MNIIGKRFFAALCGSSRKKMLRPKVSFSTTSLRTAKQAQLLNEHADVYAVFNVTQDEGILIEKQAGRRACSKCNKTYNCVDIKKGYYDLPALMPKDGVLCNNECGKETVRRKDDDSVYIFPLKRLKEYNLKTKPLIDYYDKKRRLFPFEARSTAYYHEMMPKFKELFEANVKNPNI